MKVIETMLNGVCILEPNVFRDYRGYFLESFNQSVFNDLVGVNALFVQDNHSRSVQGVLRGLHYQVRPEEQGKLVSVINGEVLDVVVDIRRSSSTFGKWISVILSDKNHRQLWIPAGFAHGFYVRSASVDYFYKSTGFYSPACERSIKWCDPDLGIDWCLHGSPIVSEKDQNAASFKKAEYL